MNGRAQRYRSLPAVLLVVGVLVLGGLGAWLIRKYIQSAPAPQKKVAQEIKVIRPPPPPPDEPPPPPPPPEEEVDIPEPKPDPTQSDEPPPAEQLGLDAEGAAGADGFGLAARPGGRDLLATGGSALAYYGQQLKDDLLACLQNRSELRKGSYSVQLRIWVKPDGRVERVALSHSSGDQDGDREIERCGQGITRAPPVGAPQPITLRLVSRA